jgi:chromosome segregation ATPase
VRWRGFTLDVAKWTFTSEQLQAIVSRAIRQSADATSLRLLPLDVLDKDIPEELEALEARAADSRAQYKVLAGRRSYLLTSITSATQESASASASDDHSQSHGEIGRLVYELTEITSSLDQLTEDMHSMSDQIRQIRALLDTHTYSALAMALRKLNGSFLKQAADVQELRQNVAALEGERDEAWKQAQEVAQEVDELNNMMADQVDMRASSRSGSSETYGVGSTSQQAIPEHGEMDTRHGMGLEPGAAAKIGSARSSKMSSRKNSVRASQISSSFRRSQRSSTYSYAGSSANRSTFGEIPPMPSMPVRRPLVVRTSDITERVSYGMLFSHHSYVISFSFILISTLSTILWR